MDLRALLTVVAFATVTGHPENDPTFEKIVQDFWEWRLSNNPEFASNVGDHRYDDMLEDYSLEAFAKRKFALTGFKSRLDALARVRLPETDRITYDVLSDTIQTWLDGYEWRYYGPMNGISFLDGIQNKYSSRSGEVKFLTEKDFMNFVQRINGYASRVNLTIERMNKAIMMKTTLHEVSMTKVAGQIEGILTYKDSFEGFTFWEPFTDRLDQLVDDGVIPDLNRTSIKEGAKQAIGYFMTQVEVLKEYLSTTYRANTRAELGVYNMPRGRDYYKACLKWHLSIDITADEIHQTGLREVERIHGKMVKIMRKANHTGTVKEFFDKMKKNETFYIQDKEETLQRLRDISAKRIQPKLHRYFHDAPKGFELQIKEMTYDGPSGIYKNGAPDGSRPGIYYANVMSPDNNPTFMMPVLLMHEADPGHHLQDVMALTATGIPLFRKTTDFSKYFAAPLHFPFYTAYSEGWALYTEDLGEELLIFKNDYEMIGKYSSEIFRAARLVVDTGIHDLGWDKERAVTYMLNYTSAGRTFLEKEIDRYSTWPGQATSYTIGKLRFKELRLKATRELGAHWDIKAFHSKVINNGAMPLSVLSNVVDEWIQSVKQETSGTEVFHSMTAWVVLVALATSYVQF